MIQHEEKEDNFLTSYDPNEYEDAVRMIQYEEKEDNFLTSQDPNEHEEAVRMTQPRDDSAEDEDPSRQVNSESL